MPPKNPDIDRIHVKRALAMRINGVPVQDIAAHEKVSVQTIERRIKKAKILGFLDEAANTVTETLLPQAMRAYGELLTDPDTPAKVKREAAADIAFGAGVLSKNNKAHINPELTPGEGKSPLNLRAWREQRATHPKGNEQAGQKGAVEETRVLELTGTLPQEAFEKYLESLSGDELSGGGEPSTFEVTEEEI